MPRLLSVPHRQQLSSGLCLPACASMVLAYWGIERNQTELAQTMDIFPGIGVPGSRIKRLASRQLAVTYGEGELNDLETAVAQNVPPIVLVSTAELPYWDISTPHAVVITGIDENNV